MTPRHEAALLYASRGCPVFPCLVGLKQPAVAGGFKAASTDPAQLNAWWGQADYNVAMCPDDIGMFVVDLDGEAGRLSWESYQNLYGSVKTVRVRTPSGGVHLYFRGEAPSSARRLGAGVDIRGRGGYVLLPPSIVAGVEYAFII